MVAWCHDEVLLGKETAEAFGAEMSSPPTVYFPGHSMRLSVQIAGRCLEEQVQRRVAKRVCLPSFEQKHAISAIRLAFLNVHRLSIGPIHSNSIPMPKY